jgi:pimeloyl-ACP methyl ester carboxylesterase
VHNPRSLAALNRRAARRSNASGRHWVITEMQMGRQLIAGLLLLCAWPALAANPQVAELGTAKAHYPFVLYANAALDTPALPVTRAVILLHGIKRNGSEYFDSGSQLLENAGLNPATTLLLAPQFLTDADADSHPGVPRWAAGQWLHGSPSFSGVSAFQVLDDLLTLLADRQRFPALREVVLIGHSAGGQLVQRYAVFNPTDTLLTTRGIHLRYGVASPSSYLYFDHQRWHAGHWQASAATDCPGYNRYRYGLEKLPAYASQQKLSAQQLFRRYAARDVVYLVGADDNNPAARVMDRSCSAQLQGATRRQRQLQYLHYEQQLAQQWKIPISHPQVSVEGIGHDSAALFAAPITAKALLP